MLALEGAFEPSMEYADAVHQANEVHDPSFDTFSNRQLLAQQRKGFVMPNLDKARVEIVKVKDTKIFDASKKTVELKADVREYAQKHGIIGTMTNEETQGKGEISISKASIDKFIDDSASNKSIDKQTHLAVLPRIRDVIASSIMAETHPDVLKVGNKRLWGNGFNKNVLIHRAYGAVDVDGVLHRVKLTLKETPSQESKKAYSYEVTNIELLESTNGESVVLSSSSHSNSITGGKLLHNVEKTYDKGVKILDESRNDSDSRIAFREVEDGNRQQTRWGESSSEAKMDALERLTQKFNTSVRVVEDVNEIVNANPELQARMRKSKGWFDEKTGEIVIVMPNNRNRRDVQETFFHETVAHKGLREMIGEGRYGEFLDVVFTRANKKIREKIAEIAAKNGYNFRKATEEYMAKLAEKGFEDFTSAERSIWKQLKQHVLKAINSFLVTLKLPGTFKLGDNELRYMLWRSHENLRGKGHDSLVDVARDAAKRQELKVGNQSFSESNLRSRSQQIADRIERMFDEAVSGNLKGKPISVGRLTNEGKAYLEELSGMTLKSEVDFVFNPSDLAHIYIRHFGANEKDSRNIPLTKEDIRNLADIITSPERIIFAKEKGGQQRNMFFFLKSTSGGSYRLLEIYSDRRGNLTSKSFLKSKEGVSQRVISLQNDPTLYVLDGWGNPHNDAKVPILFDLTNSELDNIEDIFFRDGETDDIWNDMSVGLEERITNARLRLANNHKDDLALRNEAVKSIGENLSILRQAMSRQREFDQATVKRVTDLARVLIETGYLSNMTSGEVKRLLSASKNSLNSQDASPAIQKVMDIMIDNQLRNGEDVLRQLLRIQGSKVDARGVEVQGTLDALGQQTVQWLSSMRRSTAVTMRNE